MDDINKSAKIHDDSIEQATSIAEGKLEDDQLLEQIGYKQELRREFTRWSTLSYAISIMGVLGSVPATYYQPFTSGGPATAVWAWASGSCFAMCIGLSIAELVSAYPTSGGMYFVTKHVFPEKHVPIAAWCIGWSNFLGQTAGVASVAYSVGQMILAAAAMGSATDTPNGVVFSYTPTARQTVAVSVGCLVLMGVACSLSSKYLSKFIKWFAPINLLGSVAISIALLVMTPDKHSARFVFGEVVDNSGWNSRGFSFLLGYLSVAWTMTDYDATAHISEETRKAAIQGPVAIVQAIFISGIFGELLNITFGFCSGTIAETIASPLGNPAAQIYFNAAGKKGGHAMWFFSILIQFFTGISAMLSDTRTAWALARDRALPGSSIFRKVNSWSKTPLYSVWLVVILCSLLNLIALGSVETINGIFGVTAPAMDLSYVAVIAARVYYEKEVPIEKGPFTLGRWQKSINYIAIIWTCFITVILFFPLSRPVNGETMNYAVAIAGFIAMLALGWWYIGARKYYIGPRTEEHK